MTGGLVPPVIVLWREIRLAKIIITRDGAIEQQHQLSKERVTIGRRRHNDIVLSHPAVSGEHAVIVTILDDSFLEDLQSTNGTYVNGHRIGKHFLQHQDTIKIAKYELAFIADGIRPLAAAAAAPLQPAVPAPPAVELAAAPASRPQPLLGHIEVLNGSNAGKQLALTKLQTTLGRPGVQVVVISRAADGYGIAHVDGEQVPLLNGAALTKQARLLKDGDVIDLSGTRMAFRQA